MKDIICQCGSSDFFIEEKGAKTGLYCESCGKWIKWLSKEEVRLFKHKQKESENMSNQEFIQTSSLFAKEIGYISNETLKNIVKDTLDAAPQCIQIIPASSSGRYHPKADLGDGGLVRHVRTVTALAYSLMDSDCFKDICFGTDTEISYEDLIIYQDAAIAACILHDCMKPDDTPKHSTVFDHPLKAANLFKEIARKYITDENMEYMKKIIPLIHKAISSHMGKWNKASYAKGVVLPKPKTGLEVYVHLCDYVASRKFFDFNFDGYDGGK